MRSLLLWLGRLVWRWRGPFYMRRLRARVRPKWYERGSGV